MNILLCALADRTAAAVARAMIGGAPMFFRAATAPGALGLLGDERPALVVLGGESLEALVDSCRQLRADEACRDAVVLAVGRASPQDVAAILEAGADDVLVETSDEDALRSRLLVARRTATGVASRRTAEQDRGRIFQRSVEAMRGDPSARW
jgi:DNA-binding response OmpR family regulator